MTTLTADVVRVFCDPDGAYGNLLGIVDGSLVPPGRRQAVAAELGYSETVFVDDPATGRIAIYTPAVELPFAGHPSVGTAWWLRERGHRVGALREAAGDVAITYDDPLTRIRAHRDWTPEFTWHDLDSPAEVDHADPAAYTSGHHYLWAWEDEAAGVLRARMFAPAMGIAEDEATGAAAVRFTAIAERDLAIDQGRGSRIDTTYEGDGWVTVGGRVVADGTRSL